MSNKKWLINFDQLIISSQLIIIFVTNLKVAMAEKKEYFEYFLNKLYEKQGENNDLSILKTLKLLFFTTAVDSGNEEGKSNVLIDQVFTDYKAMPYGHVESGVYSSRNTLNYFKIDSKGTRLLKTYEPEGLESTKTRAIDNALECLETKNSNIFNESAFDLVELSHHYDSWKINYNKAKAEGTYSHSISSEEIKKEDKYFKLNSFEIF